MSINIRKEETTQDIASAWGCELRTDVLLTQEPRWPGRTKKLSYYDTYLPFGRENIRPRVATCITRDSSRIKSKQKYPLAPNGNYCLVEANDIMFLVIFLNAYNAPHDPSPA